MLISLGDNGRCDFPMTKFFSSIKKALVPKNEISVFCSKNATCFSIRSGNEILFIFDLTSPEIFPRTLKDNGTVTTARTPSYPEEWKNQFGIPVEEHQKSMQVNIFEGYAVFDIQEKKKTTDKYTKNTNEPSATESEEKTYEQQTLFPSTNMY